MGNETKNCEVCGTEVIVTELKVVPLRGIINKVAMCEECRCSSAFEAYCEAAGIINSFRKNGI